MTETTSTPEAPSTEALTEAATAAGQAPSIHNTQPWRWRVCADELELWAVPARRLAVTDPDGRMATISCGVALHHAWVTLAALGRQVRVVRLPDPARPEYLARITVTGGQPVTAPAMRLYQAIGMRHTDRRPVTTEPIAQDDLLGVTRAVQAQGVHLHPLRRSQVIELASAAGWAQQTEATDEAWRAELAYWVGGERPAGTGVPEAAIPDHAPQTTVPGRDFGQPGSLEIGAGHDNAASYVLLYGERDDPEGWLRAGEALSAGWLTATELGVAALPLSAVIEVPATRQRLTGMLIGGCHPYLVLRLGNADPEHRGPGPTPRLRPDQIVEVQP